MAMNPRLLRPRATGYTAVDPDARAYIAAVRTADGQELENNVAKAIDVLVQGCKTDGTWNALTHCALLAGPRTIAGCCVALKGTAPTSNAFVEADYNRETGLLGSTANTKFLNANVNNNTFTQDNFHMSVYVTQVPATATYWMAGAGFTSSGASEILQTGGSPQFRNQNGSSQGIFGANDQATGLWGSTRNSSPTFDMRAGSFSGNAGSRTSQAPFNGTIHIFRSSSLATLFYPGRLAWYSLGTSISLTSLQSRLATYLSSIAAAIP